MTIVGGVRARLLHDSFRELIRQGLDLLGWLDPDRSHKPITVIAQPKSWETAVAANTVAIDFTGSTIDDWEVGSLLTQDVIVAYVEIYAQNDSLGVHLANDLRDWLRGRLQATPTTGLTFPIYDYRSGATPPVFGYMDIDNIATLRNTTVSEELWLRHWFRVRCEIRDTYLTSDS